MTKSEQQEFLKLIKQGSLEALKSKEAEEILSDYFDKSFKDVVVPTLEKMYDDMEIITEDNGILRMDVNYLKESAVKRDRFFDNMKEKLFWKVA